VENGRILYKKLKCSYCHTIGGEGGTTGPDLTQEGTKNRSIGWQIKNLTDPSSAHPKHGDTSENISPVFEGVKFHRVYRRKVAYNRETSERHFECPLRWV
jgi:hypothetical protein